MKKVIVLFAAVICFTALTNAQTCVIDTTLIHTAWGYKPDTLPCIVKTVPYSQTVQVKVADTMNANQFGIPFSAKLRIDSMHVDSITNLPAGILWAMNPASHVIKGDSTGCVNFYGTTTDSAKNYKQHVYVTVWGYVYPIAVILPAGKDTFYQTDITAINAFNIKPSLDVIKPGDSCRPVIHNGISNFSSVLNASVVVYPNPSTGKFQLAINTGSRIKGDVVVFNIKGQQVYSEPIDLIGQYSNNIDLSRYAAGLYTLQIRTNDQRVSRRIVLQ